MRTSILVSRIMRVLETDGTLDDGASLAEEYSAAVRKANSRLEAALNAIDAKQASDAVRMMEESPRLLDEVSTLEFRQLDDWRALCTRKKWTVARKIDKSLLERVLMFNESNDAIEPLLRMYRKAVRTKNDMLAVQSLRRLVKLDHSQNWKPNLIQAEETVQRQMVSDFRSANSSGNSDEAERIAHNFMDESWSEPPWVKGTEEIRAYVKEKEARRRNEEGAEDVTIIKRCLDENWDRQLAFSMIQAIDTLVDKGWTLPAEAMEAVEACRKRCADEIEAEEKEQKWKELCEQLHAAIQQENPAAIRDTLSAPEFLDREPDAELIKQAKLVIEHDEATRRRKVRQIAVCAMLGIFAILGVSGWWLKQKLFDDRCEAEAAKLATLQKGAHAVDRLGEALHRLKDEAPEVYADPRVNVFEGKLKTMASQMLVRTNEIASIIAELKGLQKNNWGESFESVTGRIARIDSLITKDDDIYKAELLKIKSAWADRRDEIAATDRNAATRFQEILVPHAKSVAARLKEEWMAGDLAKEVDACKASIAEWRRVHASHMPELEGAVTEAEKEFEEAVNMQQNMQAAIKKMKDATSAQEYLEARKALLDFYSCYPFVKEIGEHPVSAEDAAAATSNMSPEHVAFANLLNKGVDQSVFKSFIDDNVLSLAEVPSFYSLYGIAINGGAKNSYFAISKGKPQIKKRSYDKKYQIDGELLDLQNNEMLAQMSKKASLGRPFYEPLPQTDEIKSIVDAASSSNITSYKFELTILKTINGHMKASGAKDFLNKEVVEAGKQNEYAIGRFPAIRRVQLIYMYLTWLKDDLKVMPQGSEFQHWFERLEILAQPVNVDGVPEDLTWACMRENRVRQRNSECARLLANMASKNFLENYKIWRKAEKEVRDIPNWRIEFAGSISYDPNDRRWAKDHSVIIPAVNAGVGKDHPLYVLRRENGKLILKSALAPYKNGGKWVICAGMGKELVIGDPLFQVVADGKCIDAEETLRSILKAIPENMAKELAGKIPMFNMEVK